MRIKIIFVLGVLLSSGAGCRVIHPAAHNTDTVSRDSITVKFVERNVPVYIPGDTVTIIQQLQCPDETAAATTPKPFKTIVTGKRSSGSIEVDKLGRLKAIFNCDQWQDSVKVRDTEISRLKSIAKTDSTTITIRERFIPTAYKYSMWFTCGIALLLAAWIVWSLVKLYLKLKPL